MRIVGVGCGPGMLTREAARVISHATLLYGSQRAIDLARDHIRDGCTVHEIRDYRTLGTLPDNAIVLSTGDPMLAGLGYLDGEVIPGISSLQVALARLHIPLARVSVVSAHGSDHHGAMEEAVAEVARGKAVFLIADPKFDVSAFSSLFLKDSPPPAIILCEQLGYPDERIVRGDPQDPPVPEHDLFVILIDPGIRTKTR